ncbi:hypothetical protein EDD85DRAFT_790243 [Armillaria nabsnona]|nr:hypothetical protein EDD85DRAFT_790243 [Armillaria nabsnona]
MYILSRIADGSLPSSPAPCMSEAQADPKILGYVLAACAVCLRAYCEGCGKEIKEPGQGNPWFAATINCCMTVVAKGLLNVLSDLDVQVEHAPGGIPPSAGDLLNVIIDTPVSSRPHVEAIDDVIADIQLATLPEVDSAKWKIYLQTGRMLWGFMVHREYRCYIAVYPYCNVPVFRQQEGARAWIQGGCELESDTMERWKKDGIGGTHGEDMIATIRFFGLVLQAARLHPSRPRPQVKDRKRNLWDS